MRYCLFLGFLVCTSVVSGCTNIRRNVFVPNQHIAALILARGGSKGIKLKNIQTVGGHTLLARALHQIKQVNFDSVWVSTDHHLIAREAEIFAANIHWREPETATDEATSLFATQEFLNKHPEVDTVALVQCTSPFLKYYYLKQAAQLIKEFDCVFSVSRSSKLLWKRRTGKLYPVNFSSKNRPRRQDLQEQFVENGMFYFASRQMIREGQFQSESLTSKHDENWGENISLNVISVH